MHSSLLLFKPFRNMVLMTVVWISPRFTAHGDVFEHPDYDNVQSDHIPSRVKNGQCAECWEVM